MYDTDSEGVVVVYKFLISPDTDTMPVVEMSSMRSTAFHGMGVTGSESVTVLGTVSIMRWKRALQVVWNEDGADILSMVALESDV